ncbi:GH25 family lysozyme [Streptomyces chrestomyceticus]|uniref:GH25 family lysozyme n=1 Tax=Streptomyces chrestomyceticus TaxID=68185 RepID=UPI0036CA4623
MTRLPIAGIRSRRLRLGHIPAALTAGLALLTPAWAPAAFARATTPTAGTVRGLDVSAYQENVDWDAAAAKGAAFAYVKATEGTSYISSQFTQQYEGSARVGMVRGAYHFARPDKSSGREQADFFLNHGGAWQPDGKTLPGVLDVEPSPSAPTCYGLKPAAMVRWIADFDTEYRARTGRHPVINTNTSWWSQCTDNSAAFAATNLLWLGSYTGTPHPLPYGWRTYAFWQTADSGPLPGDQDVFNGTLGDLRRLAANGSYTPPPAPPATAWPIVQPGYRGRQVVTLQHLLVAHGAHLETDGRFTTATRKAVTAFQTSHHLDADGIVGPKTWQALLVTIKSGDKGPAVKALQTELKDRGTPLQVDGHFTSATRDAVIAFQRQHHLDPDGIVGPLTWLALVN